MFFLILVLETLVPCFSCSAPGVQIPGDWGGMQWALYRQLLNFLLGVKLPVEEDKSIDFTAELIDDASSPFPKLESSCLGCQGVLNPPSPLSCLRTLCCWLGQKLLATLVGFPMLGKSPYCLQTSNTLLALLEKCERKRGGEVENSTCHSRLSCRAGSEEKK